MEIYLIISLTCPMRSFFIPAMTNSDFMELIDNFFLVYKPVSIFQGSNVFILNNCSLFVYGSKEFGCARWSVQDVMLQKCHTQIVFGYTSPLICTANQWTGFHMIGTFVMKQLRGL